MLRVGRATGAGVVSKVGAGVGGSVLRTVDNGVGRGVGARVAGKGVGGGVVCTGLLVTRRPVGKGVGCGVMGSTDGPVGDAVTRFSVGAVVVDPAVAVDPVDLVLADLADFPGPGFAVGFPAPVPAPY